MDGTRGPNTRTTGWLRRGGRDADALAASERAAEPGRLVVAFRTPAPGVLVASVSGKLDLASAPELDRQVREELGRVRPRRLVLDLAQLHFMGLHGIAVFERLRRAATADGIAVSLAAVPPAGARALEFAGVLRWYEREPLG
jgi:anti-sigma B factor antagonist